MDGKKPTKVNLLLIWTMPELSAEISKL